MQDVPGLAEVLAPDGWPNASSASLGAGDPGRYNCLFGRDSLITALAVLPARPDVAAATLRALAAIQGTREDVTWDEEPGKIVHEVRPGISVARQGYLGLEVPDGELRYYGSADATPLFLHVLADDRRRRRWPPSSSPRGAPPAPGCWARWGAAAACCAGTARAPGGLVQQGWRDSVDPIGSRRRAAGSCTRTARCPSRRWPTPTRRRPRSRGCAALARLSGDPAHAAAADALAARIGARVGPRHDGARRARPPGARRRLAARAGCCGPGAPVAGAAERLSAPDVLTDFGLRTLSDSPSALRPALLPPRLGVAVRLVAGVGRAARCRACGGRRARPARACWRGVERIGHYPELYAVTDAGPEVATLSNFVQAWTVGAVWALRNEWDGGAHVVA